MCVVVDTCAMHRFFDEKDVDFSAINNWVYKGKGKIVIGGTKYRDELAKLSKITALIAELRRVNKVVIIDRKKVDDRVKALKILEPKADFDDPHIVAIVDESGCKIVCTLDGRSEKYLKRANLYNTSKRPKIYKKASHANMIRDANIAGVCK